MLGKLPNEDGNWRSLASIARRKRELKRGMTMGLCLLPLDTVPHDSWNFEYESNEEGVHNFALWPARNGDQPVVIRVDLQALGDTVEAQLGANSHQVRLSLLEHRSLIERAVRTNYRGGPIVTLRYHELAHERSHLSQPA